MLELGNNCCFTVFAACVFCICFVGVPSDTKNNCFDVFTKKKQTCFPEDIKQ